MWLQVSSLLLSVYRAIADTGNSLFNRHMLVRRLTLIWACALITWVTLQVFADVSKITSAVVGAFTVVTGLLSVVIGFYQWTRSKQ